MKEFIKYQHVEKFGSDEVDGINFGECYIFPKLDGSNASVWMNNSIYAGSRNRVLSIENDNMGFNEYILGQENIIKFLTQHKNLRLYGEWLKPHTLKTYLDSAWNKFYVFDIVDEYGKYVHYEDYKKLMNEFDIEYIPALCKIQNPSYEKLIEIMNNNRYLIKDGNGIGEGIVIKNYNYVNRFGRVTWAKIVQSDFKAKNLKAFNTREVKEKTNIEKTIVDKYVNETIVNKVYSNIVGIENGWSSKHIPRLLNTVFYDLVKEESWNFVKENKNPIINYSLLNFYTVAKIKELKSELF